MKVIDDNARKLADGCIDMTKEQLIEIIRQGCQLDSRTSRLCAEGKQYANNGVYCNGFDGAAGSFRIIVIDAQKQPTGKGGG